jgi:hypothetical protein
MQDYFTLPNIQNRLLGVPPIYKNKASAASHMFLIIGVGLCASSPRCAAGFPLPSLTQVAAFHQLVPSMIKEVSR